MNQPLSTDSSISAPNRAPDAVSRRAYEIWEREGRPEGCDLRHWLQAEQELEGENSASGNAAGNETAAEGGWRAAPSGSARNTGTDTRPLQGTRAGQAANRENKRHSGAPFATDKSGGMVTGTSSGGQNVSKRKPSNTPMM